jgi:hypothetical protein
LLVVFYAWWEVTLTARARVWVAGIAIGTYFLVRRITTQLAMEYFRSRMRT